MATDGSYITVQHPFKNMSVVTVERAGTGELSTLSSSNTDYIPKKIRRIFDEDPDNTKWFTVYYMSSDRQLARGMFHFEGRDKTYEEICTAENTGVLRSVFVVYKGQSVRYEVGPKFQQKYTQGEPFKMVFKGEIIP